MRTLASDGTDGKWTYYGGLSDWESAHNLWGERHFVGWLARNLAARELAEIRRAALRMKMRLTPAGINRAGQREQEAATAEIDWLGVTW